MIKVLLNITDKKALECLNITGHGKYGRDESFRHELIYLVAIDIKGKLQDQNIDEYVTYYQVYRKRKMIFLMQLSKFSLKTLLFIASYVRKFLF